MADLDYPRRCSQTSYVTDVWSLIHSLVDLQGHVHRPLDVLSRVKEPSDGLGCVHGCPWPCSQPFDHGPLAESRMQEKAFYVVTFEPLQI